MIPSPIGTRIRIIANSNSHHYRLGSIYQVHKVDDDGTFKAVDSQGVAGDYLRWRDCEPAGIGWEWLRTQLDPRSLDLLSAFEGVEHLQLLPEIEAKLVGGIEDLGANILAVLPAIDHAVAELTRNSVANDDIDEFENLFSDA